MTAWIKILSELEADEELSAAFEMARTPHGTIDNVMRVHSLRPATMVGHLKLYRACLHDDTNTIPPWFQEVVSSYVSLLNDCSYSFANHWKNAAHLIGDPQRAETILAVLKSRTLNKVFAGPELAMLEYTEKLTLNPGLMAAEDVQQLKDAGVGDGEILELNQIVGYFNYVNRLLNGLGVTTQGDVVGFYKENDDE